MKCAAVTTWYEPEKLGEAFEAVKNVKMYSSYVERVYIVDNSSKSSADMAAQISNAVYIANYKNLGIAEALNIGCTKAIKDGFDFCLTMDQDSKWSQNGKNDVAKYLKLCAELAAKDDKIAQFTPDIISNSATSVYGELKGKVKSLIKKILHCKNKKVNANVNKDMPLQVGECMTSASLMNLRVWEEVGKFNSALFIDQVDCDFCYRLTEGGYKTFKIGNCNLYHTIGSSKRTFFPRYNHFKSDARFYYFVRNCYYVTEKYPELSKRQKWEIKRVFRDYCIFTGRSFHYLRLFIRAKHDFPKLLH